MLRITIPERELFDEKSSQFITIKQQTLQLEHSLVSIAKWESKWHKPFLDEKAKTYEETLDYIRCMTLTQNVDPAVYYGLRDTDIQRVNEYMNDPMTATWFTNHDDERPRAKKEIVTAELIYYWMICLNIPIEFQKWHLNRLLTLIRLSELKQRPSKKMSRAATMKQNKALNAARRNRLGTRG